MDGAPLFLEAGREETVLADLGGRGAVLGGDGAGSAAPYDAPAVLHGGLGAVQPGEQCGGPGGQLGLGFGEQRELGVEHDTGTATGDDGRRGVRSGAAAGPDRQVELRVGEQLLHQYEGAQFAHGTAGLVAPGDQSVSPGRRGPQSLLTTGHLDEDAAAGEVGGRARGVGGQQDRVHAGGEIRRGKGIVVSHTYAESGGRPLLGERELSRGTAPTRGEVEHAQTTGPYGGRGEPCRRDGERVHGDDDVFGGKQPGSIKIRHRHANAPNHTSVRKGGESAGTRSDFGARPAHTHCAHV